MPLDHREVRFEESIELALASPDGGYDRLEPTEYDAERAVVPSQLLEFLLETQPAEMAEIQHFFGDETQERVLKAACTALDTRGSLSVIRHGFKVAGRSLRVAFFRPATGINEQALGLYAANRLAVARQIRFDPRSDKSIDVVLFLNGIPTATLELKNPMSGQTVEDAKHQYMRDRDPRAPLFVFKNRALVHFAVDPDEVWMTTRLAEGSTAFLPFNRGANGGAGNPENPNGYRTSYLWDEVLQRDSWLDIVGRFIHIQSQDVQFESRTMTRESVVFPRYHQLDAVRQLERHATENGAGCNYLVEHSAGSGKSNTIAWLAHRLATLHDHNDNKVFASVIVVTDRLVLDRQLQDSIYQFDHRQGVVQKINEDSAQLAEALVRGVPIIITTLQKFPFVVDKVGALPQRNYAVIVDEAHSSQTGEAAADMKGVLSGYADESECAAESGTESELDVEEAVVRALSRRRPQANLSFFAFTATPKYKTLSMFGTTGPDGRPVPFHLYSMKQAIEEGFILDVLQHYTTYKTYYKLVSASDDDPQVRRRRGARALARFMTLHPHNIAQKTEVIIEHFRTHTMAKIGGQAKAMVVTSSREHAVRYKKALDSYIDERGYGGIATLVAFSGSLNVDGVEYRESQMNNGVRESELPLRFGSSAFQVLIAADKYQTGFDQPLLHTMYVDKRLSGVQAVQTLSRLNRTHPGKSDTFVLDFVNDAAEIQASFEPYFTVTQIDEPTDPDRLYALRASLDDAQIYWLEEIEEFAAVFFRPRSAQRSDDHAKMNSILDRAVGRWGELRDRDEDGAEEFRSGLVAFRNLYAFVSQIIPYGDSDLEKLYAYGRFLLAKLPRRSGGGTLHLDDEVALRYYRLEQQLDDVSISLVGGGEVPGPDETGTRAAEDPQVLLSAVIETVNERFGTQFTPADELFFEQIVEAANANESLRQAAVANTLENFTYAFERVVEDLFIDRMDENSQITAKFMDDDVFREVVTDILGRRVYEAARGSASRAL